MVVPITPETDIAERGWSIDRGSNSYVVHPGVSAPTIVRAWGPLVNVPGVQAADCDVRDGSVLEVEVHLGDAGGSYRLHRVTITAAQGAEVSGSLLRAVAPLSVMRWVLPRTFQLEGDALSHALVDFVAPEFRQYRPQLGDTKGSSVDLADVATVYRLASVVRYPPARAVAETFNFHARTATNWIVRARAANLL